MGNQLTNFDLLSIPQRMRLLDSNGKFLHRSEHVGYLINLYALGSMYVELWYHMGLKSITDIQIVRYAELDKHLINIKLNYE